MNIRSYKELDFISIKSISKENMEELFIKNFGGWSDSVSSEQLKKILEEGYVYVLEDEGVKGFVTFFEEKDNKNFYIINDLHVKKGFQRKGLGSKLLEFAENKIKDLNGKRIKILVFENNPSNIFYKKKGYEQIDFLEKSGTLVLAKDF